jgi:hypothetical protein
MSQRNARHRRNNGSSGGSSGFRRRLEGLGRGQRIGLVAGAALVVVAVAVVLAAVLSGGNTKGASSSSTTSTTKSNSQTTSTTRPLPVVPSRICPLTGRVLTGDKAPQRAALAVKIGNDPSSRPQSGLDQADIVYEEMAEGGITRYMAVYQCQSAPLIGPVRSVRWDDWNILQQYGHAILAYSGGITPWTVEVASFPWIYNANGSIDPTANAFYRYNSSVLPASLGAPYNYYTSTSALWGLFPAARSLPPVMFQFSTKVPAGATQVASASVPFSSASPVVWQWNQASRQWLRFYNTQPDVDPAGRQLRATNVVIEMVQTQPGPYNESGPNSRDVESITTGTGTVYVLRHGVMLKGTWSRPTGLNITRFSSNGKPITLEPGTTWVELVPDSTAVSFTK